MLTRDKHSGLLRTLINHRLVCL